MRVVRGPTPSPGNSINRFGDMYAIDDPLTMCARRRCGVPRVVGRAQGFLPHGVEGGRPAAAVGQHGVHGGEAQRSSVAVHGKGRHLR
ncbi:hypothetical protein HU200_055384 [Digitaria exilis]|uniref:Dirigent protein n=1 Tax=Digitaria exilis TaxID=1010633 RepID=A0A835E638_9POAL|nr:hypothetical protein HU200_055384 [Digitaria exilis]